MFSFRSIAIGICLFVLSSSSYADDAPVIHSFREIIDPDTKGTLIVVDLDETLMKPLGFAGSEAWYDEVFTRFVREESLSEPAAHARAMRIWGRAQKGLPVRLLDPLASDWIRERKKLGTNVIALTARRPNTAESTLGQLAELGIQFSPIELKSKIVHPPFRSIAIRDGVIFAGENNSKGSVLEWVLANRNGAVERVIFVDNYESHLESVQTVLNRTKVIAEVYRFEGRSCFSLLMEE